MGSVCREAVCDVHGHKIKIPDWHLPEFSTTELVWNVKASNLCSK